MRVSFSSSKLLPTTTKNQTYYFNSFHLAHKDNMRETNNSTVTGERKREKEMKNNNNNENAANAKEN